MNNAIFNSLVQTNIDIVNVCQMYIVIVRFMYFKVISYILYRVNRTNKHCINYTSHNITYLCINQL